MNKEKTYETVLETMVQGTSNEADLEILEQMLQVAKVRASNKRFQLRQARFKTKLGA